MICEVCRRDVTNLKMAIGSGFCCKDCFDEPESLPPILHIKRPNRWSNKLTEAYVKDIKSRRLAEDGRSVVRDRRGTMPNMMGRLPESRRMELGY